VKPISSVGNMFRTFPQDTNLDRTVVLPLFSSVPPGNWRNSIIK